MSKIIGKIIAVVFALAGLAKLFIPGLPQEQAAQLFSIPIPSWIFLFLVAGLTLALTDAGPGQKEKIEYILSIVKMVKPSWFSAAPQVQVPQQTTESTIPQQPPTPGV